MLAHLARAAELVHERDLCGEISSIQQEVDVQYAEELRALGRLH